MRLFAAFFVLCLFSDLRAQDIGSAEPPFVESTASMPTRLLKNADKRSDMLSDLAAKSGMNYRVLAMKAMEKWQASIKNDKTFLKDLMQHDTAEFTVRKDGTIEIHGTDTAGKKKVAKPAPTKSSGS